MTYHKNLAAGRWREMTLAEQLGNAGSEFARAVSWKKRADRVRCNAATERFYELMDLTLTDPRWTGRRRRELARLREQATEELLSNTLHIRSLQKYFDEFAIYARSTSLN